MWRIFVCKLCHVWWAIRTGRQHQTQLQWRTEDKTNGWMERKWDRRRLWSTASQFGEDMGIEMDLLSNELALTNHLFIYGAKVLMIKLNKSPSAALSLPPTPTHTQQLIITFCPCWRNVRWWRRLYYWIVVPEWSSGAAEFVPNHHRIQLARRLHQFRVEHSHD